MERKNSVNGLPALKKGLQESLERLQDTSADVIDAAEKVARRARNSGMLRAVVPPKPAAGLTGKFAALKAAT